MAVRSSISNGRFCKLLSNQWLKPTWAEVGVEFTCPCHGEVLTCVRGNGKQGEELECSPLAAPQHHWREHSDSPTAVWAVREWRPHSMAAIWTWPKSRHPPRCGSAWRAGRPALDRARADGMSQDTQCKVYGRLCTALIAVLLIAGTQPCVWLNFYTLLNTAEILLSEFPLWTWSKFNPFNRVLTAAAANTAPLH